MARKLETVLCAKNHTEWTKAAEVSFLDDAIAHLGDRSYLGPWLRQYRDEIVRDIYSDFAPRCPLPSEAVREGRKIMDLAITEARQIRESAENKAKELMEKTRADVADVRRYARQQLEAAAGRL